MTKTERLSDAFNVAGEEFLAEVVAFKQRNRDYGKIVKLCAATLVAAVLLAFFVSRMSIGNCPVTIYAYGAERKVLGSEPMIFTGSIDDHGSMHGLPVRFYVNGENIEKIRFSCQKQWITGTDWTEKRENYGLSKNFTIAYGKNMDEYASIVIEWVPNGIIRTLTDHDDVGIADLSEKEREDVIVMEITFLNGEEETLAVHVSLQLDGYFSSWVSEYEITSEDTFVFQSDVAVIYEDNVAEIINPTDNTLENNKGETSDDISERTIQANVNLTDAEWERVCATIENYYAKTNHQVIRYELLRHDAPIVRSYDGYNETEVIYFEVIERGNEIKRYIAVGSKDQWMECVVLNEGY